MRILDGINCPSDLKQLNASEISLLCEEIRDELINTISANGGHLASNLGVVELTTVLLRCFDLSEDNVIFDIGHQSYVYKLLTGRVDRFNTIRKKDGLSGFPRPYESEYDLFSSGHSSTSLSSAIGLARAKALDGQKSKVIAIIGDGAFGGGMVYEAMNTINATLTNLIVILNDNSMSISRSVGGISQYLLRLRTDVGYSNTKRRVRDVISKTPLIGEYLTNTIVKSKAAFRRSIYDGRLFEEFGFNYIGPVDGHDIFELNRLFRNIKSFKGPMLIHINTVKGKGFAPAEKNPGAYHGVSSFNTFEGSEDISSANSFSNKFGKKLTELAAVDNQICAVTAAMKYATGLNFFKSEHPDRFFDVGIAEEHAVTFSAGLAVGNKKPVFAVYSTFLQRGYDQLFQDVALDNKSVLFAIDRAGLVGEDGETHHGLLDVAYLSSLKNFMIASPCNYCELDYWLESLIKLKGPRAIRYPRGSEDERLCEYNPSGKSYDIFNTKKTSKFLIVSYGRIFAEVVEARDELEKLSLTVDIIKLNIIFPIDSEAVNIARKYSCILFVEEGVERGGINELFLKMLKNINWTGLYKVLAIKDFIKHGTVKELISECGLDSKTIVKAVKQWKE